MSPKGSSRSQAFGHKPIDTFVYRASVYAFIFVVFFDKKKLYTVDVFDGCVKDFPRGGAFGVCGQAFGASIYLLAPKYCK